MSATCETCRFWADDKTEGGGECRKALPRAVVSAPWLPKFLALGKVRKMVWRAAWPLTEPDDWCGEHQPAATKESKG
jgi:hypothetical protein